LEIVEEEVNLEELKPVVNQLKQFGFKIAIDDVGKGASTLRSIIELEPNFVKMDRFFGIGLEQSVSKRRLIQRLIEFCGNDITFVLEGIEYHSDLEIAKDLGVHVGQGYFLGRPALLENFV
jgi:EAL domain-containing protein (putative c-di-GMP-specific phosphodiesterase class I)